MAQQLIQTVNFADKAKGLGLVQFSCHYSAFKMVGMKERIALIKAISRGYQLRRMFSEVYKCTTLEADDHSVVLDRAFAVLTKI